MRSGLEPVKWPILGLLLLVGLPFVATGLYEANQSRQELSSFARAVGAVVDNSYRATEDNGTTSGAYYPVVEFKPADGRPVRFTDGVGSFPPDYDVGEQVDVLYNPADDFEARINSWKRLWLAPTLLTTVGALPIFIFVLWIWGGSLVERLRGQGR